MKDLIRIGTVAKLFGITTKTLRYYDEINLLVPAHIDETGKRYYRGDQMERIEQILFLKGLDFSLEDISYFFESDESIVSPLLSNKLMDINQKLIFLKEKKQMIHKITSNVKEGELITKDHVFKEMHMLNQITIEEYNKLSPKIQLKIVTDLYYTGTISNEAMKALGRETGALLQRELRVMMVSALLNNASFETEEQVMTALISRDLSLAKTIQNAMFTFEDVRQFSDETIKLYLKRCDRTLLTEALQGSSKGLYKRIIGCMSDIQKFAFEESYYKSKHVTASKSQEAKEALVDVLKQMEEDGEITIDRY